MIPHELFGGCTPTPRKERVASVRMNPGMVRVVYTMMGPSWLGSICLNNIFLCERPNETAASIYSSFLEDRTCDLTTRAIVYQPSKPIVRQRGMMLMTSSAKFLLNFKSSMRNGLACFDISVITMENNITRMRNGKP